MRIKQSSTPIAVRPQSSRSGFTLVELMVVIGIIAVLAALLFPMFARIRQGGQRTVCMSNLKQLGLSMMQYTADNDHRYPGAGQFERWGNGGHWVKGTNNGITMSSGVPTVINDGADGALFKISQPEVRTGNVADVQGGSLYPYVKNANLYVCPSDPYGAGDKDLSYSMNCAIGGMSDRTRLKTPSEIILLVDEAYGNDAYFYAVNAVGSTDALAQYHVKSGNILFCDGHVKSYAYDAFPLSKDNGPLKVRLTEAPRFYDAAFDTTAPFGDQGFYNAPSNPFGTCEAP